MNKREKAILDWLNKNRPYSQEINVFEREAQNPLHDDALFAWIAIAFEAGRQFQADNPNLELGNASVYL